MELRDLKSFIWYGDKKATEGRGLRDIVIKHAHAPRICRSAFWAT